MARVARRPKNSFPTVGTGTWGLWGGRRDRGLRALRMEPPAHLLRRVWCARRPPQSPPHHRLCCQAPSSSHMLGCMCAAALCPPRARRHPQRCSATAGLWSCPGASRQPHTKPRRSAFLPPPPPTPIGPGQLPTVAAARTQASPGGARGCRGALFQDRARCCAAAEPFLRAAFATPAAIHCPSRTAPHFRELLSGCCREPSPATPPFLAAWGCPITGTEAAVREGMPRSGQTRSHARMYFVLRRAVHPHPKVGHFLALTAANNMCARLGWRPRVPCFAWPKFYPSPIPQSHTAPIATV